MKVIALYLPQFHVVEENSRWWGEGFTEWTTVKTAKKLYSGHLQPKEPLNGYYYNLLEHKTMEWQAKLMKKYEIDGVCIYHYWFKDGKRILEKPAENLLTWKDIDMPFCFSWANETWARTWSNLAAKNVWASEYERMDVNTKDGILLEQKYGDETSWREHFYYLLPFFKDKRYIKIDGKPVFMFHKLCDIYCFENMIDCWQELARENGLKGIYVIGNSPRDSQKVFIDKVFMCEPGYSMRKCNSVYDNVKKMEFDDVWKTILSEDFEEGIVGGFVNYDDTPRHGVNGVVIENTSPAKLEKYCTKLFEKNMAAGNNFVFFNAWNEWGEGMYLEPDAAHSFDYLRAVQMSKKNAMQQKNIHQTYSGYECMHDDYINVEKKVYDKEQHLENILDKWLEIKELGKTIFDSRNEKIAVYGYGLLGRHLLRELEKNAIRVEFIVDRREIMNIDIPLYRPDEEWPYADIIIVTATYEYGQIYKMIKEKNGGMKILSLEHLIMECI